MSNSVDGHETVEDRGTANNAARIGQPIVLVGWFPDPHDDSMQRYWTGESWSTDARPAPILAAPIQPPLDAEELWSSKYDPPEPVLPAVIETPDVGTNSRGASRWYTNRRLMMLLALVTALVVIGILAGTNRGQDNPGVSQPATTVTTTTSTPATTTTQSTTTTVATTTSQATTTTQAPATTTQAPVTTQAAVIVLGPEDRFLAWVGRMNEAFEGGPPPEDDRALTEANAAFLCARATGDETFDSLVEFVRQFLYEAAPQDWDPLLDVLADYSTAYVDSTLTVYCPVVYAQLLDQ